MKVVLFCGGQGMRIRDYADNIPKPMVPLGDRPVLWHLMKYYAHYGHKDFILCLGYKGDVIKRYFLNYDEWLTNDFVLTGDGAKPKLLRTDIHDWKITFVDTGHRSSIGERLKAVEPYLLGEDVFFANYSDGLTDLPIPRQLSFFKRKGKIGCFLCVRPTQSVHAVRLNGGDDVTGIEDLATLGVWINGGFFIFTPEVFKYIRPGEDLVGEPLRRLAARKQLVGYKNQGFWACMDTYKEKQRLDDLLTGGNAPWLVWSAKNGGTE
jgi:glucose-1-phosphate cytidylyltransferase